MAQDLGIIYLGTVSFKLLTKDPPIVRNSHMWSTHLGFARSESVRAILLCTLPTALKEMLIANMLSRAAVEHTTESDDEITDEATSILSTDLLNELKENTQKYPVMQGLPYIVCEGLPCRRTHVNSRRQPYWPVKDTTPLQQGLLVVGDKIIIPNSTRQEMVNCLHEIHQGICRKINAGRERTCQV